MSPATPGLARATAHWQFQYSSHPELRTELRSSRRLQVGQLMIRKSIMSLLGLLLASTASADWALNMPRGVTDLSAETYGLHMMVFWWCVGIGVVVFGAMIYSLIKHRKAAGAEPATFSHSTSAEIIWTVIPCVILLLMAVPAAETLIKIEDSRDPDMTVIVTGYQWKWHYKYQDDDIEFYSSLSEASVEARRKG